MPAYSPEQRCFACLLCRMTWAVAHSRDLIEVDGPPTMGLRDPVRRAALGRDDVERARQLHARRPRARRSPHCADTPAAAAMLPAPASRSAMVGTISAHGRSRKSGASGCAPGSSPDIKPANRVVTAATCHPICAADQPSVSERRSAASSSGARSRADEPLVRLGKRPRAM